MSIREYLVIEPPSSAEVEAQVHAAFEENVAVKGLLQLTVRAARQVPLPPEEIMTLRIRRQEHDEDGSLTSILGHATIGDSTDSFKSDSVKISLASDRAVPASAYIVAI